jgi:DNA-binding transcriptional ArsR family regulator
MPSALDPELVASLASPKRLQILEWPKDPKAHFPPQRDGDLVKDGVCVIFIANKLGVSQPTATTHLQDLARRPCDLEARRAVDVLQARRGGDPRALLQCGTPRPLVRGRSPPPDRAREADDPVRDRRARGHAFTRSENVEGSSGSEASDQRSSA